VLREIHFLTFSGSLSSDNFRLQTVVISLFKANHPEGSMAILKLFEGVNVMRGGGNTSSLQSTRAMSRQEQSTNSHSEVTRSMGIVNSREASDASDTALPRDFKTPVDRSKNVRSPHLVHKSNVYASMHGQGSNMIQSTQAQQPNHVAQTQRRAKSTGPASERTGESRF